MHCVLLASTVYMIGDGHWRILIHGTHILCISIPMLTVVCRPYDAWTWISVCSVPLDTLPASSSAYDQILHPQASRRGVDQATEVNG